jgi:23S rRNA (pseudouridine1915-N3)-methyltransferase
MAVRLVILSPGKVKEAWMQAGMDEYVKRLGRYAQVTLLTVDDVADSWPVDKAREEEARRLLQRIKPQAFIVALDLGGKETDSPGLARLLADWQRDSTGEIVFVIGGPNGLSPAILNRAQATLCLSRLTFTHQMSRLILLEQCYRAFRILSGEPYHK